MPSRVAQNGIASAQARAEPTSRDPNAGDVRIKGEQRPNAQVTLPRPLAQRKAARLPWLIAALCLSPCAAAAAGLADVLATGPSWTFRVSLDGKPIGEHRFISAVAEGSTQRNVRIEATFEVRFLGLAVYRYHHLAVERWRGDCLVGLSADTDDNGRRTRVRAALQGEALEVTEPAAQTARGCVMSFAYWNPAMRAQHRLLNAQTGRIETVSIAPLGETKLKAGEVTMDVTGWRIGGLAQPIDVWYSRDGEWVGLDTLVDGGRALTYRRL